MKRAVFNGFLLSFLLLVPSSALFAGELDPDFDTILRNLKPGETATGVVCMAEKVDLHALTQSLLYPVRLPADVRHEQVVTALMDMAEKTQAPVLQLLSELKERGSVESIKPFWIANVIGVTAEASVFYELASRADVAMVHQNVRLDLIEPVRKSSSSLGGRGIEPGINGTKAPQLWSMGIKGQGVIVCNIDTGVAGFHPALDGRWRGLLPGVTPQEAWFDPVTHTTFPQDFNGHGTHTMGTICGYDGGSNQVGMAPEALWIAAATIDRVSIEQTKLDAYASFQWCADPDGNPGTYDDVPAVASNSWGLSPIFHGVPKGWDYFYDVIDGCEAAGCAVVFAAGNEGWYGSETLRCPADRITSPVNVLSVGALNVDQTTLASFSSLGPSGVDHFTKKPEVTAQGDSVRSSTMNGSYGNMSGTSMACPHVAGGVALLRCAYPDTTAYEIKAALLYSADDLGAPGEDNQFGMGIIDMVDAYNFLDKSLIADTKQLSISSKQEAVIFSLRAGSSNAGRKYILLGSVSGTSPGLPLPGGLVLPLNWDYFTHLTLVYGTSIVFQNFFSTFDASGTSVARLQLNRPPDPALIGLVMYFAFTTTPPPGYDYVSNAWDVEITQ